MASNVIKATTGLTGLKISHQPHHTLKALYGKILRAVQKMPEHAAYRKYTERIVKERVQIVNENPMVEAIEKKICCGQIEELIIQAENELFLARKMVAWKPWDPLLKEAPEQQWQWPPAQLKSN